MRLLLSIVMLLCSFPLRATIWTCADCNAATIQAMHDSASVVDGDTIIIPAGTCNWAVQVTISKAITLQGSGIGSTIIQDTQTGPGAFAGHMLQFSGKAGKTNRITAVEFTKTTGDTKSNGHIVMSGDGATTGMRMRLDHCKFSGFAGNSIVMFCRNVIGCLDHNICILQGSSIMFYIYHDDWKGGFSADKSYHDPSNFGSDEFMFIEDNEVSRVNNQFFAFIDAYRGARYVVRSNRLQSVWCEMHGTDSGQRQRGTRAVEIYNNEWSWNHYLATFNTGYLINQRSGVSLVYSNTYNEPAATQWKMILDAYRRFHSFTPWGQADGVNVWDTNDPANPYVVGTATGGGTQSLTDSTKTWITDQWVGYEVRRTSPLGANDNADYIVANTPTTLTTYGQACYVHCGGDPCLCNIVFSAGDQYQINRVIKYLDQPGRAEGSQLAAADPPTAPAGWNDQINEPCRQWQNKMNGVLQNWEPHTPSIELNVNYIDNASPPVGYVAQPYPHYLQGGGGGGPPPIVQQPAAPRYLRVLAR